MQPVFTTAILIDSVTFDIAGARVNICVGIITVSRAAITTFNGISVSVIVSTSEGATGRILLVNQTIAVVVLSIITNFYRTGINCGVIVVTVYCFVISIIISVNRSAAAAISIIGTEITIVTGKVGSLPRMGIRLTV